MAADISIRLMERRTMRVGKLRWVVSREMV
jgi:hypothetical protein